MLQAAENEKVSTSDVIDVDRENKSEMEDDNTNKRKVILENFDKKRF